MALLNCTRKPRLTCTLPLSSTQGTRNMTTRSGSTMRSRREACSYSGWASMTGSRDWSTSVTAWMNSGCSAFFAFTCSMTFST